MKCAVTIGSYDGVHLGHQKIIKELTGYCLKNDLKSVVIYFPIPPKLYIHKNWKDNIITTHKEREKILKSLGVEEVVKLNFNEKLSQKTALEFFADFIIKKYDPKFIVVGKDFSIGKNREANYAWLREISKINGLKCKVLQFVKYKHHKISSSLIRQFLHLGRIKEANFCLGRNYSISGVVIKGAGIGRKMGYPTANLEVNPIKILPKGIFAVIVKIENKYYKAVASIGVRPTLKTLGMRLMAEVHILNFDRDIYGETLEVFFVEKIRNEMKFLDMKALIKQIETDIAKAEKIFSKNRELYNKVF